VRCIALAIIGIVVALPMAVSAQDHSSHQPTSATPSALHDHHELAVPSKATAEHAQHNSTPHAEHSSPTAHASSKHVPPDPPQHPMRDMSEEEMIELMGMDDTSKFLFVRADSFEWRDASERDAFAWDIQGWYGGDYTKLWVKSEGEARGGETESRNEVLVDRVIARWWSLQVGIRHDISEGPARTWLAFGTQGLAPYWFEVEATAYVGEDGRTALRLSAEYELLLTQRLVLQPEVEINAYGKTDEDNLIGQGLSDAEASLRLRYEFRREVAPYVGVAWQTHFGETADLVQEAGHERSELHWLAGVRWWF
jgi:copper resistance protein B